MSEQKPSNEVEGIVRRARRQDCVEAQIRGTAPKKMSAALKVPKDTVASIILKWKKFGTTETLPRAGRPAKLCNRWRRAFVMEVNKYPMVTERAPEGEPSRRTTISAALHHSQAFMVELPDRSYSSVKRTTARLEFAKMHLKT
jgi:hypothetical protein